MGLRLAPGKEGESRRLPAGRRRGGEIAAKAGRARAGPSHPPSRSKGRGEKYSSIARDLRGAKGEEEGRP